MAATVTSRSAQECQLAARMLDHCRADQQGETPTPHGLVKIAAGP
jgi:hypothetical protein